MVRLENVQFAYRENDFALDIRSLEIPKGEKVAFVGPSGCGKTTLMYLISGILLPNSGRVEIDGTMLSDLGESDRRHFRVSRFGFIFQEFELLEYLSVRENILLPYYVNRKLPLTSEVENNLEKLVDHVGLMNRISRRPHQLSHGERQRVAICRALVTQPDILVADEPTSSLDQGNASRMMERMLTLVREQNTTFLMLTHDRSLLESVDRVVSVREFVKENG